MQDPHANQPIFAAGEPLGQAHSAMLLVHGRGANAEDILSLAPELSLPGWIYLAPQAAGSAWYPDRFLAPTASNQPWLDSALRLLERTLQQIASAGIPAERTVLLGFSQGACLALEYAARHAQRYAGLVGLSGGLIGADGEARQDQGNLSGTPVFLGCADPDPHIPAYRVEHAGQVLTALGGIVTTRLYPGMGHTISDEELEEVRAILASA
jgi:predicted esterase